MKDNRVKTFAFALSRKSKDQTEDRKWRAREGVSEAACTGPLLRAPGRPWGGDNGMYC